MCNTKTLKIIYFCITHIKKSTIKKKFILLSFASSLIKFSYLVLNFGFIVYSFL